MLRPAYRPAVRAQDADPWVRSVDIVPVELSERQFIGAAVPQLASGHATVSSAACVVVCHVTAPARNGRPGGPVGRAKGLLDALHDNRPRGPFYRDLGVPPPLANDDPAHVSALAVEVDTGHPRTEYMIGTELRADGHMLASMPVGLAAPNDIAGTPSESVRISEARRQYGAAVREAFAQHEASLTARPGAVIIRHWPQRDADNTWHTWITAICGAAGGRDVPVYAGSFREIMTTPVASWTYQGHELPYLPNVMPPRAESALDAGEPVALSWTRPDLTANRDLVETATIPVENIDGAVLLIVGADDIGGDGVASHDGVARRLEAHKHPHTWRHIVHPGAGHNIIAPPDGNGPLPTTGPGPSGITFLNGGTPEIDHRARADTWRETLDFLQQEL